MTYTLLACVGLMCILKYGSILSLPRDFLVARSEFFESLFDCSLCLGFWSGVLMSVTMYFIDWTSQYCLLPFASAACCWFFDSILGVIQSVELNLDNQRRASVSIPEPQDPGD